MKFKSRIKFFGLAFILGGVVCPFLMEKANAADPVTTAHDSSDVSPHEATQIVIGQGEEQLTLDENTHELKDAPHQLKADGEV